MLVASSDVQDNLLVDFRDTRLSRGLNMTRGGTRIEGCLGAWRNGSAVDF